MTSWSICTPVSSENGGHISEEKFIIFGLLGEFVQLEPVLGYVRRNVLERSELFP